MPRYMLFKKTKRFDYKFVGSENGTNGDKAIKKSKMRGSSISNKDIIIAIPSSQFMKYQLNPRTAVKTVKMGNVRRKANVTTWKKPR